MPIKTDDIDRARDSLGRFTKAVSETESAAEKAGQKIDGSLTASINRFDSAIQGAGSKVGQLAATIDSKIPSAAKSAANAIAQMSGSIASFGSKATSALSAAGGAFSKFGGVVSGVIGKLSGPLALVAGFLGARLGKVAETASIEFTDLNARLEALTGSAEIATRKLAFAQSVANPSNLSFQQLADATVILSAFGINSERALPTVARLAMAFGAGNEQLKALVRGLGDLSSGKFFDADLASSFGLNRTQFSSLGIEFDGNGKLLSSASKTFEALEKIVTDKYGAIFDKIASTPGAKLASLGDAFEKLQRIVGDGILKVLTPGIERLTSLVSALGSSGVALDAITSAVNGFQNLMGATGQGDFMTRFVAGALSVVATLPDAAQKFGQFIGNSFNVILANTKTVFSYIYELVKPLLNVVGRIAEAFGHFGQDMVTGIGQAIGALDKNAKSEMPTLKSLPNFPDIGLLSKQKDYFNRLSTAMKVPVDNSVPMARGQWLTSPIAAKQEPEEQTDLLGLIAKNTGKSADLLSLRAQATGTGASNVVGPTAAELQGGNTRRVVVETAGFETEISKLIKKLATQIFNGGIGSGYTERAFNSG